MSTVHVDQYTFLVVSCSVFIGRRSVSDKSCGENQSTHCMFN